MSSPLLPLRLAVLCVAMTLGQAAGVLAAGPRQDPATVTLAADLRRSADAGSPVLAPLVAGQAVTVLEMRGAQARVDAGGTVGWMPAAKLRLGAGAAPAASSGAAGDASALFRGLTGMLGGATSSAGGGAKVPIGVRGLKKEDLAHAVPDPAAVERLERFTASPGDGQAHASAAGLASYPLDYRAPPARPATGGGGRSGGAAN